jgi:YHS domain-containing protein
MTTDSTAAVERPRDPVCGMNVRLDVARSEGLVADHDGHRYYFCRAGCRDEFLAGPARFIAPHEPDRAHAALFVASGAPEIDDGMRLWYESCACCLSDAYPEVKAALDAERGVGAAAPPGICEVAEASDGRKTAQAPNAGLGHS